MVVCVVFWYVLAALLSRIHTVCGSPTDVHVTVVTCLYNFKKSKHAWQKYERWTSEFLRSLHKEARLVVYTTEDLVPFFQRPGAAANLTEFRLKDMWEWGPLPSLREDYERIWSLDPEKDRHSADLYAVWNIKSFFVHAECEEREDGARHFCFWVDMGSFRQPFGGDDFMDPSAVSQMLTWQEGKKCSPDCPIFGLIPLSREVRESLFSYNPVNGPMMADLVEGGFYGGSPRAMSWFLERFWKWHDWFMKRGYFVGKDQSIMNAFLWHFRDRVLVLDTREDKKMKCGDHWFQFQQLLRRPEKRPKGCVPGRVRLMLDALPPSPGWAPMAADDKVEGEPSSLVVSFLEESSFRVQRDVNAFVATGRALHLSMGAGGLIALLVVGPSHYIPPAEEDLLQLAGWTIYRTWRQYDRRQLRRLMLLEALSAGRFSRVLLIEGVLLAVGNAWESIWGEGGQAGGGERMKILTFQAGDEGGDLEASLCGLLHESAEERTECCGSEKELGGVSESAVSSGLTILHPSRVHLFRYFRQRGEVPPGEEDEEGGGGKGEGEGGYVSRGRQRRECPLGDPSLTTTSTSPSPRALAISTPSTFAKDAVVWKAEHVLAWGRRAALRAQRLAEWGGRRSLGGTPAVPSSNFSTFASGEETSPSFPSSLSDAVRKASRLLFIDYSAFAPWKYFEHAQMGGSGGGDGGSQMLWDLRELWWSALWGLPLLHQIGALPGSPGQILTKEIVALRSQTPSVGQREEDTSEGTSLWEWLKGGLGEGFVSGCLRSEHGFIPASPPLEFLC
uniref:Nucleotide-diphospho-sugar transferase domain-containing protein n=1 Tax=Chromera velia CCMP2878 TaxID=1169474 RepID=A0A0G4G091_9ALVE|eukprot:Cvel_19510.t1-p1 / transcript=Cvel_19510.t1 / gene=Cvel_19510 / organism=Chromera_velia_CCMP2878 / gene_product=hypothetical protein / transcript_product=hypothetical protein / location=Cvel_scaffold1688:11051-13408(+) / protein_length=786 / sequence_SO=supercontig / SO=protein_coding / is_pseudo=false